MDTPTHDMQQNSRPTIGLFADRTGSYQVAIRGGVLDSVERQDANLSPDLGNTKPPAELGREIPTRSKYSIRIRSGTTLVGIADSAYAE